MKFKNSIMTKMLIMFFAATIPLYAVGLALYNTSGRRLSMETLETKQSQIEFYLQSLEDDLERLFSLETELINDSAVGSLATRYDYFSIYEQGSRINTLRDRLSGICKSSAYAVTTSIYLRPMQMKLNDASGLDLMTSEDESFIAELKRNPRSAMRMDEDALYSVVCIRDTMNEPYYTLATEISRKKLREDLLNLESGVPADCLIVFDGDNVLASSSERARTLWKQAGSQMESLPSRGIRRASIGGEAYYIISAYSPFLRARIQSFVQEKSLTSVASKYIPYLMGLTIAAFFLVVVLCNGTRVMIHQPLRNLMNAFHRIREGDMTVRIDHRRSDEFCDVYQCFNDTAEKLDEYVNHVLKQELLLQRAEILQLQAQINPHFLYNSYFLLRTMVKRRDWQNAEKFLGYMGEYFRYITRNAEQLVPLKIEAQHARVYSEIQQMRFGNRIRVDFGEIPEKLRQIPTPRLILQPVLENAFEHGMRDTIENGLIRVRFFAEGEGCAITVEDNGESLSEQALNRLIESMDEVVGEVTALRNICHRLQLRATDGLGFELLRSPLGGLCVRMILYDDEGAK